MFVALIYKHPGSTEIDRIIGGFASNEAAAEWCSDNLANPPFDIRELEHYEALGDPDEDATIADYFTGSYRPRPSRGRLRPLGPPAAPPVCAETGFPCALRAEPYPTPRR